jgi:ATP-dependent Lhr-like helicase
MSARTNDALAPAEAWFASLGRVPFAFQRQVWGAYLDGRSGLLHAPTGMGKTLAVALGPMLEALAQEAGEGARGSRPSSRGLRLLWLTPLRALAADTAHALEEAARGLGLRWDVELRTGDSSASSKQRQRAKGLPRVLVTTPESLSVLLSYPDMRGALAGASCAVVDEWHELIGSKRGVQAELELARVRALSRGVRTWGVSATLGNTQQAMDVLLGAGAGGGAGEGAGGGGGVLVRGEGRRAYDFRTILPPDIERFPWAGHLGLRLLGPVIEAIEGARSTLLFTNTRSQSEIWFGALLKAREDWMGRVAIHHGSLEKALRSRVEAMIAQGQIKCCVCTSSLDLGVDFAPVDQVIQVGSPKGIARLLQRAGRSGHQPGGVSRITCVPTSALELVEFAAAREAVTGAGAPVESREALTLAMDVLVQHVQTLACGAGEEGLDEGALLAELRSTHAFAGLTGEQWSWVVAHLCSGGPALGAYAKHRPLARGEHDGRLRLASARSAGAHRLNIGTILSDVAISVRMGNGRVLGSVEESFISRMKPGDTFAFAGRVLQLVRVREMVATVRPATRKSASVPSWQGSRMPLSSHLARIVREKMAGVGPAPGEHDGPEMRAVHPVLSLQARWSGLPAPGTLLIEHVRLRDGWHAFVYPVAGRLVHEGLAALCAHRFSAREALSFTLASADHGFHLHSLTPFAPGAQQWRDALSTEHLARDVLASLNAAQLARRQFREIARVAGLISQGYPGQRTSGRQLQASSELFYDVFSEFDPANLLLDQARREVLERQLEFGRMSGALAELAGQEVRIVELDRLTPLAFPLWVDSLREQVSTQTWGDRVQRMLAQLERQAGPA